MNIAAPGWSEPQRLAALDSYAVLDTPREPDFDDIVRLTADIFAAPISVVNLIASGRQWFKAEVGIGADELPLDVSICAHALLQPGVFIVPDTTRDERFVSNPLVTGDPGLRFYAGALLVTPDGLPLGTLCVLDTEPRPYGITEQQRLALEVLARQVMAQLELRRALADRDVRAGQLHAEIESRHGADQAQREAAERYRLVAKATSDAIWDWEFATNQVKWNEALEVAYGHRADDVVPTGDWWIEQIHSEDRARIDASIHAAIDGAAGSWSGEYRFRRSDGAYADVLDRGHIIRDESGGATRMIGAMLDLTERRRAQAALAESEERLRLATEAAEVGFWDVDVEQDALIWPSRVKAMFGISPDVPVTMRDFYDGVHPDDREATSAMFAAAADPIRRALYDVEYRTIGKEDGIVRWVAAKGRGLFDAEGRCTRIIGTALDVTARKRAEHALIELNETLERQVAERTQELDRAWRLSQELQAVASESGLIESVNARWTELLGWSPTELVGSHFEGFVHPDDLEVTMATFVGIMERPLTTPFSYRFRHKDGSYRWFGWTAAFEAGRVYAVGRDLTAEKEQERDLARAEEQLRQAQKMEAVGQLTGGIAHDFNNLLTGITGSLEIMQVRMAQGRTGDVDRYVTAAQGAAKRAAALTHRLLAFSRRQTLAPKPTDVRALVTGMEDLIRRSVGPEIELDTVNAAGLWTSLIDPGQLENAILNLCINARDAMPHGGRITIETANRWMDRRTAAERGLDPGQYISLCVSDTGAGMSPEIAARVFEPFFTTKPIGMGTGLGLSMIYGFAKQSGGTVMVYSEVGQGSMLCIYLPRHLGDALEEDGEGDPSLASRAEAGETVLVVDDEPTVRMLVAEVLNDLGYTTIEAGDGPSGLKVLNSGTRVDLLVTDVGLPGGMNGRQVADAARTARPGLKVLFITGYAENAVLSHGHLDAGMHILTKPFSMDALAGSIKDVLAT